MKLKPGIKIMTAQPELLLGLMILVSLFREEGESLTITEVTGGEHMQGSFHYQGLAADIRSRGVVKKDRILEEGKRRLGSNFDFILEGRGTSNEHFHLEVDPK